MTSVFIYFAKEDLLSMKKRAVLIVGLMLVLVLCLVGCNTNFNFKGMELSTDNVSEIIVTYGDGCKPTIDANNIAKVLNTLNSLDLEQYKEKVADSVFNDSVGKIEIKIKNKEGSLEMSFVEVDDKGNKISLLKCDATSGLKINNMKTGVFKMNSVEDTDRMLSKIFATL